MNNSLNRHSGSFSAKLKLTVQEEKMLFSTKDSDSDFGVDAYYTANQTQNTVSLRIKAQDGQTHNSTIDVPGDLADGQERTIKFELNRMNKGDSRVNLYIGNSEDEAVLVGYTQYPTSMIDSIIRSHSEHIGERPQGDFQSSGTITDFEINKIIEL